MWNYRNVSGLTRGDVGLARIDPGAVQLVGGLECKLVHSDPINGTTQAGVKLLVG